MKIAFLITSLPEDELQQRQFPLGAGYLGAYLEQNEQEIEVTITASLDEVLETKPDMLGISAVSQCFQSAKEAADLVKKVLGIPVVLGGYHISALPRALPESCAVGVIGEGERPMLDIVRLWRRTKALDPQQLANINGICFRADGGQIVTTPACELIHPIDSLPFPKRNIRRGARNIHLFSSRGCVYRCKYCASTRHWRKFRAHSAEYVVKQLKNLIDKYDATSIYLLDDLFFADKKRFFAIATLMEKADLIGRLTFHGFITSNLADRDVLQTAKEIGFSSIRFGAETGSDRLLKIMKGNQASVENHQRCIDLCEDLDIEVRASFMFGAPGETEEDIKLTHGFLQRNMGVLKIDGFYLTTPIPGTPYWRLALDKGLVTEDETMDWNRLNLDILKQTSFSFDSAIYLNEENITLNALRTHLQNLREEFVFHSIGQQPKQISSLTQD